jgi:pimeloyl-ACP methyl ester carboxylesterase
VALDFDIDPAVAALLDRFPARTAEGRSGGFSYRTAGEGPPLVLLHGIGSGSGSWVRQLASLASQYRVIAWDAPGYGDSSPLAPPAPTAADYAAALADFLDALELPRVALVGHSLGAIMAAAFARRYPARVAKLVLASPAGGYGTADAAARERRLAERLQLMAELGPEGHAQARAPRLVAPEASAEAKALVLWNLAQLHPEGYAQAARMLAYADIKPDVAAYPHALLVVCGTADTVTPEASCRAIAAAAPRGVYRAIAGAGHICYIEAPNRFGALVRKFLGEDA